MEVEASGSAAARVAKAGAKVCGKEEKVVGEQKAPGSCPYCGGVVTATDVEAKWVLCFLPLCLKTKRSSDVHPVRAAWLYPAPGSCPYCGGGVTATDVEAKWVLCFLPLCLKTKRRFACTACSRRLVTYPAILHD